MFDESLNLVSKRRLQILGLMAVVVCGGDMRSDAADAEQLEKEKSLLSDTQVPEGFEATVFAAPPMANYPVYVASSPDGILYVSSDGNSSLDRELHRGRVLRLRDLDNDGRADEVKEFVADVDSPRGLVWDHDRLYLMHPPHLSAFIDHDGDGVADEEKVLVKNIAFGFADRPADHTSNGLSMGVDGWIYCAVGDFGFMDAEGTDGRRLQLRGGGVVRVRPDGSGLELFSRGTRNILEVAVSPTLDLFARDNTNDGGGWDVRFHHFTGLEEHGYPSLYKNFNDEMIQPLADYGGGSGCGAAWIDEPGIPALWNNSPFTADWGRNRIFRHKISPNGATYFEEPTEFFGATRITDLDPDASSNIYIASWKGASYRWAGPEVGYIVRLTPKGYKPTPVPDFASLSKSALIEQLESDSYRRRVEAQCTLLRSPLTDGEYRTLEQLARNVDKPLAARIAAIFVLKLKQHDGSHRVLSALVADPSIAAWAIRALCDVGTEIGSVPAEPIVAALNSSDARVRREAVAGLARLGRGELAGALVPLLGDSDLVIAHTAVQALKLLNASEVAFAAIDETGTESQIRTGALRVLQSQHDPRVVDGLISRLESEQDLERRKGLLTALSRLHFTEGTWNGESWGTRPDTSGPYYSTVKWEETPRIAEALKQAFAAAEGEELSFLVSEFDRHKIRIDGALDVMIDLASKDASLLPSLIQQLVKANQIPKAGVPLIEATAKDSDASPSLRAEAVGALAKVDDPAIVKTMLDVLTDMSRDQSRESRGPIRSATSAFLSAGSLSQNHEALEKEAASLGESGVFADAALLKLSERKDVSPEARDSATLELEKGWVIPERQVQILQAVRIAGHRAYKAKIIEAVDDPNEDVVQAARRAARTLRIDIEQEKADMAAGQLIANMQVEEVLVAVMNTTGDVELGSRLFTQQACIACHTVTTDEVQRGPYLGNIAATFKRRELAENILMPNKTLAQGFVGNRFELKDGSEHEGFVTLEAADKVTIRNIASQEIEIVVSDIVKRETLDRSLMPEGLAANLSVREFASLLDYLEALNKK